VFTIKQNGCSRSSGIGVHVEPEYAPEDWKEGVADFDSLIEQIKLVLNEYQNKQFWEGLK
jgi:hypothetical protein